MNCGVQQKPSYCELIPLELIQLFQRFDFPLILNLMKGITMLGNHFAYPAHLLTLAFFIDRKELIFLIVLILVQWGINELLKLEFAISQPPDELHLFSVIGYGFPSGHAQMSMVLWGWIGRRFGILVPCALLIILIGISRIYLGVHYPNQVLGGWVIGFMILMGWSFPENKIKKKF